MPIRLAYRFTAYHTTSVVTPSSCRVPFFETRLNTLPSVTPVSWIQTSMRPLHHAGTGTVRIPACVHEHSFVWSVRDGQGDAACDVTLYFIGVKWRMIDSTLRLGTG